MTTAETGAPAGFRRRAGRDRDHARPGRTRQVKLRYSDTEYAALAAAARLAGLTVTGYAADAALAAATDAEPPSTAPWRAALVELMEARTQVRRIGVNVNQAAAVFNATGEAPPWLEHAITLAGRAVTRLDHAAGAMAALARHDHATGRTRPVSRPDTPTARAGQS